MSKKYYFDYAAATPVDDAVIEAMLPYFKESFYNPSALYLGAQASKKALDESRAKVAKILGAKPPEIVFTAGGTESDNLAIRGVMERFPDANCIVSSIEHDAVLAPAKKYDHKLLAVNRQGLIDIEKLAESIDERTVLVSTMYANNEIGSIQPISEISRLIKKVRDSRKQAGNKLPIYLHTDACQAANYLHLLVNTLGVDLMTLNGGKIYGPKQSGILYIKTGVELSPQVLGGGQERGFRSGTENVAFAVGFAKALEIVQQKRVQETKRLTKLKNLLTSELQTIPGLELNGTVEARLANNVHITIPGVDNERLMMELDEKGIMVAVGSACSASSDEPSHVLKAIGLSDEMARSSLRITLGRETDEDAVKTLSQTLSTLVAS